MSARTENSGLLEKATSTDFSTGAQLTPEQFEDFMMDVQDRSEVLSRARMVPVDAESGGIPRLGVGTQLLQAVNEGNSVSLQGIESSDIAYATQKVSLPWEMTWESSNEIVDNPEARIRQFYVQQFSNDLEILASLGDEGQSGFQAIEDGWLARADATLASGNQIDHGSASINKDLFNDMVQAMPQRFREQQDPVFLVSFTQKQAYKDYLTDRSTGAGDAMLMTDEEPMPYGYEMLTPLSWPDDRAMFTSMENLLYIVQDDIRRKSTSASERNVLNDIEEINNLLAKIDYEVARTEGVVTARNIAAP